VNDDFSDLLHALLEAGARFLVVGAHAMAVHGVPRATGDLDVWIATDQSNVGRVWQALAGFGAPMGSLGITQDDLKTAGHVVQIGMPPRRIDIMTSLTGLEFEECWPRRVVHTVGREAVPFLGREDLLANKRATGRARDLADIETLERGGTWPAT
jgi:hypothetical protein